MNQIYVSVVATRRLTKTVHRSVHLIPVAYDGPSRAIERFASRFAEFFCDAWDLNIMQITQFEFKALQRQQQELEEMSC